MIPTPNHIRTCRLAAFAVVSLLVWTLPTATATAEPALRVGEAHEVNPANMRCSKLYRTEDGPIVVWDKVANDSVGLFAAALTPAGAPVEGSTVELDDVALQAMNSHCDEATAPVPIGWTVYDLTTVELQRCGDRLSVTPMLSGLNNRFVEIFVDAARWRTLHVTARQLNEFDPPRVVVAYAGPSGVQTHEYVLEDIDGQIKGLACTDDYCVLAHLDENDQFAQPQFTAFRPTMDTDAFEATTFEHQTDEDESTGLVEDLELDGTGERIVAVWRELV
ncbi:hypothetical protein FIV42_28500 [Persicimonas caeni]|uniref:Uncharacterized protein n=1 Tax=Persicimonas caeni TaxID=2292766 RepID=A0A4Y6Q1W3_PERCE|nr:hypothetical protein [Persicimonas caeni]QDG54543.1 hypothetical protein FIV42_28500 [Persicimonas caeni]QED35764.1 hypothetical protein FRD00_28495 [Persicimonas caeni]